MRELEKLLIENESFLMNRILAFAKKHSYTRYTSTLEEAWRLSISGLTNSFIEHLKSGQSTPQLSPDFEDSPLTNFAKEEAKLHQERGVSIGMFLGLFKYYRQVYMDLCDEYAEKEMCERYKKYFLGCFDAIEVAFCTEWCNTGEKEFIESLQQKNRYLTNEKNAYLTVFESLADPVFMVNFDREVINLNHAADLLVQGEMTTPGRSYYASIINSSDESLKKSTIYELLPWVPKEMLEPSGGGRFKTSKLTVTIESELKYYEIVVGNMLDVSEKFTASIISLRDLTDYNNTELKLVETLNTKNQFLSLIAHDVISPLSGIIGLTELLELGLVDSEEDKKSYISSIHDSSTLLLQLINELLEWTQTQTGSIKFEPVRYKLKETVLEIEKLYREVAKSKGVLLKNTVDETAEVFADKKMLTTVLRNLISNAIKFTKARGEVIVGCQKQDDGFSIFIKDTGVGIPPHQVAKLFKQNMNTQRLGTSNEKGTGLGLLLCSEFVKLHHGEITVSSIEGKGSEFFVTLPDVSS